MEPILTQELINKTSLELEPFVYYQTSIKVWLLVFVSLLILLILLHYIQLNGGGGKIKNSLFNRILRDFLLVFLALTLVIIIHECAHCIAANYFNLEQKFTISFSSIGSVVKYSDNEFINRVVNIAGLAANVIAAILAILILFVLQVFLPEKERTFLAYRKDIYKQDIVKLFLLIFILANLLISLFSIFLYPYTGVF